MNNGGDAAEQVVRLSLEGLKLPQNLQARRQRMSARFSCPC